MSTDPVQRSATTVLRETRLPGEPVLRSETRVTLDSHAPAPPLPPPESPLPAEAEQRSVLLGRLLGMADGYRLTNRIHQASEMYFDLLHRYPETVEGVSAHGRLIEIGDNHERNGETRQARSIFERLL